MEEDKRPKMLYLVGITDEDKNSDDVEVYKDKKNEALFFVNTKALMRAEFTP